jgi:hypothetical protein
MHRYYLLLKSLDRLLISNPDHPGNPSLSQKLISLSFRRGKCVPLYDQSVSGFLGSRNKAGSPRFEKEVIHKATNTSDDQLLHYPQRSAVTTQFKDRKKYPYSCTHSPSIHYCIIYCSYSQAGLHSLLLSTCHSLLRVTNTRFLY